MTHLMAVPSLKEPAHEQPTDPLLNLKLSQTQETSEDFDQSIDVADEDLNQDYEVAEEASVDTDKTETKDSAFDRLTAPDTADVKRPRVPSWDEILFGAPPSDED